MKISISIARAPIVDFVLGKDNGHDRSLEESCQNPQDMIHSDGTVQSHAYSLVEVVAPELHCRVRNNTDTVGAIPTHETPPAFLSTHFHKSLPH